MTQVMVRADGGANIGWGHVYRSLALVQMLHRHFECTFISDSSPEFLRTALNKINVQLINVAMVTYQSPEQRKPCDEVPFDMQDILSGDEIVVLDGYWFGTAFQTAIKEHGCRLAYIDDLHDVATCADLIINPSWEITDADYNAMPYTKFAFRAGYSLLRPSFLAAAQQDLSGKKTNDIFICFGGADPLDLTIKTLQVLKRFSFFFKIHCITGPSFKDVERLEIFETENSRIINYHNIDESTMAGIMKSCLYGIAPCSSVLLEAIACDAQCITCYYAKNQESFHSIITKKGMLSAGWADDNFEKELAASLQLLADGYIIQNEMRAIIAGSEKNFVDQFKLLQR